MPDSNLPSRLSALRRAREYFSADTKMDLKLSPIEVMLIGSNGGVGT